MRLIPDKRANRVLLCETFHNVIFVFPYSFYKIGSYSDIKSSVSFTGEDVYTRKIRHQIFLDSRFRGNDKIKSLFHMYFRGSAITPSIAEAATVAGDPR